MEAWRFQENDDTCVLLHRATGACVELNNFPGAWFHLIERRGGKAMLCEEDASIKRNRSLRSTTDKAIAKLEGSARSGNALGPDWTWQGYQAMQAGDQLALYRPKRGKRMVLSDIVGFALDPELIELGELNVSPMLVLHPGGLCFVGVGGQCIVVQENRMVKIGIPGQHQPLYINTILFETVQLQPPLVLLFLQQWTRPILQQHDIDFAEFEQMYAGGDSALQEHVLDRTTNPTQFVWEMRAQESSRHCCKGFYTARDSLFLSACKLQRRFQRHQLMHRARKDLRERASARLLQNAYRGHIARCVRQYELIQHEQRLIERRKASAAQAVQLAWRCRRSRQEPRPLRPDCRPTDGGTYLFFIAVSAVDAALLEQRGPTTCVGPLGTGVHLFANARKALSAASASGLTWRNAGDTHPAGGRSLENPQLAEALTRKTEFTQQEWEAFGIKDLRSNDFIRSGDSYFHPLARSDVVLEVAVDVGKVCDLDVNPDLRAVSHMTSLESLSFDSAWYERELCVWKTSRVTVRQRVIWRTKECRFKWFYMGEEEAAEELFSFSDYDSLLLESHYRAWDEGQGTGSSSVTVILCGPFKCQFKAGPRNGLRRGKTARNLLDVLDDKGAGSRALCKRHACLGTEKAGPVRCRPHGHHALSDDDKPALWQYNPPQTFHVDFAQMKKTFAIQGPTMQKLLAQSAKRDASRQGSRAILLPPVPPSSLSVLSKKASGGFAGNLRRLDWLKHASVLLAAAWRCRIARRELRKQREERERIQAATWLQGACRIILSVRAAQSARDELRRDRMLQQKAQQLQNALLRLLGKPFSLLRISDLLRNTSADIKKSKYYKSVMAKAISFCLEQNHHDLVKLLMDEGVTLDLEAINVQNVNVWLARETPQSILDLMHVDNDTPDVAHEANQPHQDRESDTEKANRQTLENLASVRRVNAWLKGVVPDDIVDELTHLKRENVRLRLIIDNHEAEIKELQSKCWRLERVERELVRKDAILKGMLCCKCEKTPLTVQYSNKPIGEVCDSCRTVVRKCNEEIEVGNGRYLAKYGQELDFYNGLDVFCGRPLAAGEAEILKAMAEECSGPVTGLTEIVTGNYGSVVTDMKTEWEFVFDPDPRRSYPGSELIITQDPTNPGKSMRVGRPMLDANGKPLVDEDGKQKFWPGRRPVKLKMFLNHPIAQRAKLLKSEIVGLRLYTGPAYLMFNGLLRMGSQEIACRRQNGENCYTYTISAINSGIRKLVQVTKAEPEHCILYRGTARMKMPAEILALDAKSVFVECGFSSATPRREVALQYSGSDCSTIFEIQTGSIDKGATLDWVSQYPSEGEHVILPLSNFQILGMRQVNKTQVIRETQRTMISQRDSLIERLEREQKNRFKDSYQAFVLRRGIAEAYDSQRRAARRLQATVRAMRERHLFNRSRLPVYQRPPVPSADIEATRNAGSKLCVEHGAESQLQEQYVMEREREESLRKERAAEETARLESRLRLFFSQLCPEKTIFGPEEVLAQTANAQVTSQEQRVNSILRTTEAHPGICLELDLTSTEAERDLRRKLIEIYQRIQHFQQACQDGWAKKYARQDASKELVNIYEVKLNVNLNAMTIEQLRESRKNCAIEFARTLLQESRQYLSGMLSWDGTLGLKWVKLGASRPPNGSEIKNAALAHALVHSNEFTLAEFDGFGVSDLSHDSYVKVDLGGEGIFFKPRDSIRAIERRLLEQWENKPVDWFNKDVSNFKEAIDMIFDEWTAILAANVEDLQIQARQQQTEAEEEGSARKMDTALKLLNRAIFIAERASGISCANAQQFLYDLTEEQSRGKGSRPGVQLSTSIFAQASLLFTPPAPSASSMPSPRLQRSASKMSATSSTSRLSSRPKEAEDSDPEHIFGEVLPLLVKGLKIRHETHNTPSVSLAESQKLLRDIMQTYTPELAVNPDMARSFDAKDVLAVRANLDLVTFFHLELIRLDDAQDLANTARMVCNLVRSLVSFGIKSFEDFVSFMTVEDVDKLQLPPENSKDVLTLLIRIINLTKQRHSELKSEDTVSVESFVAPQSQTADGYMTEEQANKLLASLTSFHEFEHDALHRPVILDGLARLCSPPLRLDKLVHLVGFEAKDATKLPLLEKGVQAIGMLLAVAEGANPICIPNDQGSIAVGHAPGSGSQPRYYCQQKIRGQKGICAADNRGQQCKWCSKLQHQADFTILPLQEEHVVDIRENQMSMTDCGQALIKVMNAQLSSTRIQAWACTGIGILASQGNEGQSRELLQAVTRAIAEHKWQEPVLLCALRALNKLLDVLADKGFGAAAAADTDCPVDYSSPKFIMEQVTDVLIVHRRNIELQILCFKCLYSIASEHPKEIAAGWGLEAIIRALREYCSPHSDSSLELHKLGRAFLQRLCCDGETCARAVAVGVFPAIVNSLETYPADMTTPLMGVLAQIIRHICKAETSIHFSVITNMLRIFRALNKNKAPAAEPYRLMCEMVYTLACTADRLRENLVRVGAKEWVNQAMIKFRDDSLVAEWGKKGLSALNPPTNNSACCVIQ